MLATLAENIIYKLYTTLAILGLKTAWSMLGIIKKQYLLGQRWEHLKNNI